MTNEIYVNVEKYQKAHHRKIIWYRILSVLSAITIFVTTYALILPAITKEPSPGIKIENSFVYENEEMTVDFFVKGRAVFENQDVTFDNLSSEMVELKVSPLDKTSMVYAKYQEYADFSIGSDDLYKLSALRLTFTYEGEKLDMDGCEITAKITSKRGLFERGNGWEDGFGEDVIDRFLNGNGIVMDEITGQPMQEYLAFSSIQGIGGEIAEQDTVYLEKGEDSIVLSTKLSSGQDTVAFALYSTINPKFTVQYYSHVTVFDDSGDKAIDVIDTSGGILPQNGKTPATVKAYLNYDSKVGAYVMAMHQELAPLYKEQQYEYISAPGVVYVDRNRQNGNFVLSEVWVLKSGKSPTSVNKSDWNVYLSTVSFTNREASANSNRIYVSDDTVIRLVYDEVDGNYTSGAMFYDYDISDGYIYTSATSTTKNQTSTQTNSKAWYAKTANYGINKFNVTSGNTKLAFGNVNTGTNFGKLTWKDQNGITNTPNQYNTTGFDGCTFGLVTGMNDDDTLKFAGGITAPKMFGYDSASGKTVLNGYSLQFTRTGDTYVLTSVNGTSAKNLQYFTNPSPYTGKIYTHIFTNNFWPMDSSPTWGANGHDLKFGNYANRANRLHSNGSQFPESDDGKDHNSFFGMNYEVEFTLSEDYLGHLEYIFYGDDDMWVFLDGQLVCDIGGVHSSVGQYVNLWDYINKMPDEQKYGKHTLSFYYTERGASGSTCYMQFTLPSVSTDVPQVESNTLEVGKTVQNSDTTQSFDFTVELFDQHGVALVDDYSYTLHAKDGTAMGSYIINSDSNQISLSNGQYIEIKYLPKGVRYRITEGVYSGFHTTYTVNGGGYSEGYTAEGAMIGDTKVWFTNSTGPRLPDTGGGGVLVFGIPLMLAAVYAVCSPIIIRKYKKRLR